MANLFGILTAITLAIAAFVALKNKAAYQTQIESRQAAETTLQTSQKKLETVKADVTAALNDIDKVKAEIPAVKAREAEQKKTNDALTADKATKTQEIEANKTKLAAITEKTQALGTIRDLATKMGTISNELKDLDVTITANEAKLANFTAESNRVEAQLNEQRKQVELRSKGESFSTLKTRISAVYPNWGFVTLAAGNNAGVITNSTLDVLRDGEVIAKLLVTAVERNSASASIVPESVQADTVLSVGDQVVPGVKAATAPQNSAAPAAKTPGN